MKGSNQTTVQHTQSYELIWPTTDRYGSMATFPWIWRTGKLHLHWQMVKTRADDICTGPRSKEEMKRREEKRRKQRNKRKRHNCFHILRSATSELILPRPSIPIACISQCRSLSESSGWDGASAGDLASRGASAGDSASFVAVGNHRSYTSIAWSLIRSHLTRKFL